MIRVNTNLRGIALFLILPSTAPASTWYVNGISGNNANDCKSPTAACKTIGHAITLATSGDSIMVAPALSGNKASVQCVCQCATEGGGIFSEGGTVVINDSAISANAGSASCSFPRGGFCHSDGGGIFNANGTMMISESTINGNSANESGGIDTRDADD